MMGMFWHFPSGWEHFAAIQIADCLILKSSDKECIETHSIAYPCPYMTTNYVQHTDYHGIIPHNVIPNIGNLWNTSLLLPRAAPCSTENFVGSVLLENCSL
mgnify:FL=1